MRKLFRMMITAAIAAVTLVVFAEAVGFPEASDNVGGTYSGFRGYWAEPSCSYLYSDGEELVRVEYISGRVAVEWYNADFELRTSLKIMGELPVWGGFFAGADYNFLVYGQENPNEDDTVEVLRVVRYTKDWQRMDHASFYGINTVNPFSAGGFSAAEYGGLLYIHAGHTMYQNCTDYTNHQSGFTVSLRQRDMTVTDEWVYVSSPEKGYVSHSYNQHLLVDREGRIVILDHGDALPRGAWLFRWDAPAGTEWPLHSGEGTVVTRFDGEIGDNETNAYVTGLAETKDAYLSLYTTMWEDEGMNLYLARTPKEDFSATEKRLVARDAGEGRIVPVDDEGGWILWMDEMEETMYCAPYTAAGEVGEAVEIPAKMSDCQPIVHNGNVVWYVTDYPQITFYTLNEAGVQEHEAKAEGDPFVEFYRGLEGDLLARWSPAVKDALYYGLQVATEEGEWQTLAYSKIGGNTAAVIWNEELPPAVYTRFRLEPRDDRGEVMEEQCYEINGAKLTVTEETALRAGEAVWHNGSKYLQYDGLVPMSDAVRFTEKVTVDGAGTAYTNIGIADEMGCASVSVGIKQPGTDQVYDAVLFTDIVCRASELSFHRVVLAKDAPMPEDTGAPDTPDVPVEAVFRAEITSPAQRDTQVVLSSETYGSGGWLYAPSPFGVRFTALKGDGYTLEISQLGCLTWTLTDISFQEGDVDLGEIELAGGDVNLDDRINIMDMASFRQNFGKMGEEIWDIYTDTNGDHVVNIMDMGIFRQNFGKTAAKDCTFVYSEISVE